MTRVFIATLSLGVLGVGAAHAMGLGEISQQSALGKPLRIVIPIIANAAENEKLASECLNVVPATGNDFPQLRARATVERKGLQSFVVLTTSYPIDEPIMRVAVQAGCRTSISREYTVLLDPVAIGAQAVELAAAAKPTIDRVRGASAHAPPSVRRVTPATVPRLRISPTVGEGVKAPAASTPPRGDREALMAIEEQTVVLQRQIAELTRQMEVIQKELREAQNARAAAERTVLADRAQPVAAEAARPAASWWSRLRTWLANDWPLIVLAPLLVGLLAARLAQRRTRRVLVPQPLTATQAESFNAADLGEPSVPGATSSRGREVLVASIHDRPRGHMIPPAFVDPIEPEKPSEAAQRHYEHDPGINFDEEVRKAYEQASEYSVLEREEPGIVSRLLESWGTPRATAQLDNYLLAPRRNGKALSRGAMEELKLLRSIAVEQVADLSGMHPRIGNLRTPAGATAGTH